MISKCSLLEPFLRGAPPSPIISALSQLRSQRFKKDFRWILIAVLVWLAPAAYAEDISDPMRPVYRGSGVQKASGGRWVVTGILISPERRLAMINDRLIGVGEKVDGARVKTIRGNGVELDVG